MKHLLFTLNLCLRTACKIGNGCPSLLSDANATEISNRVRITAARTLQGLFYLMIHSVSLCSPHPGSTVLGAGDPAVRGQGFTRPGNSGCSRDVLQCTDPSKGHVLSRSGESLRKDRGKFRRKCLFLICRWT